MALVLAAITTSSVATIAFTMWYRSQSSVESPDIILKDDLCSAISNFDRTTLTPCYKRQLGKMQPIITQHDLLVKSLKQKFDRPDESDTEEVI